MVHVEMELQPAHRKHHHSHDKERTSFTLREILQNEESNAAFREVYGLFRPVLVLMGILGLWHPSKRECSDDVPEEYRFSTASRWIFIFCSCCNILYTFANFIMLMVANPPINMQYLTYNIYVILLVWVAYACILSLLYFRICEKGWVFEIWEQWAYWARISRYRNWDRMRNLRSLYLLAAFGLTFASTAIVGAGLGIIKPGEFLEQWILTRVEKAGPGTVLNHNLLTADFAILTLVMFATATFTTAFFATNCAVITDELQFLYEMMQDKLDGDKIWNNVKEGSEEISTLELLRRRRLECREMVESMDRTFEHTAFISIFAHVPLIVFIAYAMMTHKKNSFIKYGMCIIALVVSLFQLFMITVAAAWVNKWADQPKRLLHTLRIHNYLKMTRPNQASLSLFLSELTSESLGITAWELSIITKEFIATVIGLAISYIIVLYEFGHMHELLELTEGIDRKIANSTLGAAGTATPEVAAAERELRNEM